MNNIFDWIRDRIDEESLFWAGAVQLNKKTAMRIINEAEAKWEQDCCIRVVGKPFTSSCGQKYDKWTYIGEPYCSRCGKRIKISEVE